MTVKLKNNVVGYLNAALDAATTTFDLQSGNGANFPSLGAGEYFYATIIGTGGTLEIVKATARSTDTLTVVRAQEGTTASSFAASSRVEMRVTAQSVLDAASDAAAAAFAASTAADIAIADAGGYYTGTNVEAALQEAAQAATTTILDTGGYYTGGDVETALQEVGASLATKFTADGTDSMTGVLKLTDGSSAAPSLSFDSDTNTGLYRKGADTIGIAVGGTEVGEISAKGTTLIPPGVMMPYVALTAPTGWVRANGRTIGSAASGATERANADTSSLYTLLWNSYSNSVCPVSTGRGASAAADFAANKTITLPDLRGRSFFGLDDMGSSAASRLGVVMTSATTNGASGGTETHTLVSGELPAHTHTFSGTTSTDGAHTHTYNAPNITLSTAPNNSGNGAASTTSTSTSSAGSHSHTFSGTTSSTGSGTAHANMPPAWLTTYIIKL